MTPKTLAMLRNSRNMIANDHKRHCTLFPSKHRRSTQNFRDLDRFFGQKTLDFVPPTLRLIVYDQRLSQISNSGFDRQIFMKIVNNRVL